MMVSSASPDTQVIRAWLPAVPDPAGEVAGDSFAELVFLENTGDRLTELSSEHAPRFRILDTVSMSIDGLTYRMTIRKGYYFHCGAEITAGDVVATVSRVLGNRDSVSQLHHFVERGGAGGFMVQAVSRYRFEIRLNCRLPDLLHRLALPEFTIRHEGRPCFSGLWRVKGRDKDGLTLAVNSRHPDRETTHHTELRWEKSTDPAGLDLEQAGYPFILLYSGSVYKSPPQEVLNDEHCRMLETGQGIFLKLSGAGRVVDLVRSRIAGGMERFCGKNPLWWRFPLTALVPRQHLLHQKFTLPRVDDDGSQAAMVLQVSPADPDYRMFEKFCRFAREELHIDCLLSDPQAVRTDDQAVVVARPLRVHSGPPGDLLTAISNLRTGGIRIPENLLHPGQGRNGAHVLQFCQDLVRTQPLAPLVWVPWVVRTNRSLKKGDAGVGFRFADLRGQVDAAQRRKLNDDLLRSLGSAVQMFAHDMKRPFTMLQGMLDLIATADNPARMRQIAGKFLPSLAQAVRYTDGLIQDILEIGSDSEPELADLDIREMVNATLREVFAVGASRAVRFEYRFRHVHRILGDINRVGRVLVNIVVNAVEAMPEQGVIWFETSEDTAEKRIRITIGNSGSFIPEELRQGIFDRFFSEGKKKGTGLGLAIVKKIVLDHGGTVWCDSDRESGTSFSFTLPYGQLEDAGSPRVMPESVADIRGVRESENAAVVAGHRAFPVPRSETVAVLVVDDDRIYAEMVQELLGRIDSHTINLTTALSYDQAVSMIKARSFDAAIVDVDLGGPEDGIALVRLIRLSNSMMKICVHSSGPMFELQKAALNAGADLFLPKPMTQDLLGRFLASVGASRIPVEKGSIILVDDDGIVLESWSSVRDFHWHTFDSPTAVLERLGSDRDLPADLLCVVVDYTFSGSEMNGVSLAAELVRRFPGVQVFLATDRPLRREEIPVCIKAVVSKDPGKAMPDIMSRIAPREA